MRKPGSGKPSIRKVSIGEPGSGKLGIRKGCPYM
jgi:hypothetical protein